ncbi:hypothetical protein MGH68_11785 [Erysipelothrix sp. D19-032]
MNQKQYNNLINHHIDYQKFINHHLTDASQKSLLSLKYIWRGKRNSYLMINFLIKNL